MSEKERKSKIKNKLRYLSDKIKNETVKKASKGIFSLWNLMNDANQKEFIQFLNCKICIKMKIISTTHPLLIHLPYLHTKYLNHTQQNSKKIFSSQAKTLIEHLSSD